MCAISFITTAFIWVCSLSLLFFDDSQNENKAILGFILKGEYPYLFSFYHRFSLFLFFFVIFSSVFFFWFGLWGKNNTISFLVRHWHQNKNISLEEGKQLPYRLITILWQKNVGKRVEQGKAQKESLFALNFKKPTA